MNAAKLPAPADVHADQVLDASCDIIDTAAKAARRDRAMSKAHADGHDACDICGRAIKNPATAVHGGQNTDLQWLVGPECAKKLRAMGLFA